MVSCQSHRRITFRIVFSCCERLGELMALLCGLESDPCETLLRYLIVTVATHQACVGRMRQLLAISSYYIDVYCCHG